MARGEARVYRLIVCTPTLRLPAWRQGRSRVSLRERMIGLVVALAVASVGILGSVLLYVLEQRGNRRERLRQQFGDALTDVYRWTELPYRIRRRRPAPDERFVLSGQMSDLQERLQHHRAWLQLESVRVHRAYAALLDHARALTAPRIREAWEGQPLDSDPGMSFGDLEIDIAFAVDAYVAAVARHLRGYPFLVWR